MKKKEEKKENKEKRKKELPWSGAGLSKSSIRFHLIDFGPDTDQS